MISVVILSKKAKKDLLKVPWFIAANLHGWILSVEEEGLENIRKISGYHDEALSGIRKGQRSIRLNHSYRAIYEIIDQRNIKLYKC